MKILFLTVCILSSLCFFSLGALQSLKLTPENTNNRSVIIHQPRLAVPDFTFTKDGQSDFTNKSLKNKWTLFFIGYTFCPDVCPTTLADLDRIYPELINDGSTTTQVVFVSVDPSRDKAEQLADYVNYFNENFIGVTGEHKDLWPFATALGLIYSFVEEGETDDFYFVDHSASIVLINPAGEHHATFKSVPNEQGINHVDMDLMAIDIKRLQTQYFP